MNREEIEKEALEYLKINKKAFFAHFLSELDPLDEKIAFFTAGPSGAGKTEFVQKLLKVEGNLLHLDIDKIREFFSDVGYDGSNSNLYQKPASRGVQYLFDHSISKKSLSIVLDSNLSNFSIAKENIDRLLKRDYRIEIVYIYNDPKKCFLYTKQREAVTKRVVPEKVFLNSVIMSRKTTYEIKEMYGESVVLNIIDKRNDKSYEDVSGEEFLSIIPEFRKGE